MSSPKDKNCGSDAARSASAEDSTSTSENPSISDPENMKRAAAKQLIEKYYYQLTDGCGNPRCRNEFCASSGRLQYVSRDEAAVRSLQLFMKKEKLCEPSPAKMAKLPSPTDMETDQIRGDCKKSISSKKSLVIIQPDSQNSNITVASSSSNQDILDKNPGTSTDVKTADLEKPEIPFLTEELLQEIISKCKESDNYSLLIRTIGKVYSTAESLNKSYQKKFRKKPEIREFENKDALTKEELRALEDDLDKDHDSQEMQESSPDSPSSKDWLNTDEVSVDIDSMRRAHSALFALPDLPFQDALLNALIYLSENAEMDLRFNKAFDNDPNFLNMFIIVMEIPNLQSPEYLEVAFPAFCKAAGQLPIKAQTKLAKVWSEYTFARIKEMTETLHQLITVKVITGNFHSEYYINDDETITSATKIMKILFHANMLGGKMDHETLITEENEQNKVEESLQDPLGAFSREPKDIKQIREDPLSKELRVRPIDCRKPVIPFEEFYNELLSDQLQMDHDYAYYKAGSDTKFSFMNYPFILTPATKNQGLYYDNRIRMYSERRMSILQSVMQVGLHTNPYLRLKVKRDHIIDDALVGLEMVAMENPNDLKKQLVVEFEGEQGVDEGGVSKEFFQLVVEAIFNPDFAMFTYNEETHCYWFNPTSFESDAQFTLIGIVLGLAIYNNIILDVHFPMVVYRKLLGKKGTFDDLSDSHLALASSLKYLLDFDGNVEETFLQTFRIGYQDVFGFNLTHDLIPNGEETNVTNQNRQEFVELYADFLLNKSVEKQFRAFKRGFHMVTDESPLNMLFRPEEVEQLVCGSKNYDFNSLEDATEYDGGYTSETQIIRSFWEIVHELKEEDKRKLLQFTTGSDRVPVGGLAKLKLIIARNGPDSERLPTAHTCFNVLLLPEYSNKEKLRERLLKAITYSKGFGIL